MSRIPAKIGKYQIDDKIAEGGMGAVFRGTHPTLEKPVVLKKLTLSSNEHLIERFRREAKIMMEFSSENIVRVYDHFKNANAWYIVQELVDGKSVDILLKKERYLRFDEAMYIFYYACKALEYAHRNQVIHRDIKPANILVSKTGEIKLVDFGIAQSEEEDDALTKEGMALGTPSYMAPEQYDDSRSVGVQADIYSLGIMLYEMVTGKKPFPGKMSPETLAKIHKGKYTPPRKVNPTLPSSLNWYMKHCIQPKAQKRASSVSLLLKHMEKWYQSADTDRIREDLTRIVNDQERLPGKPQRRKAGPVAFLVPALILLLAGGGVWLYRSGFQNRTIFAKNFGGLRLVCTLSDAESLGKPADKVYIESKIIPDDEGRIPNEVAAVLTLKPGRANEEGVIRFESRRIDLPPGSYWIKTVCDETVWWQNLYLSPYSDSFLLKPAEETIEILSPPAAEAKALQLKVDARSRADGANLNDLAIVSVAGRDKKYRALEDVKDELVTGEFYYFKIEAEGYYPFIYDLRTKINQDLLVLEPRMIPREGWLIFKSAEELPERMEIRVNDSALLPPAGLASVQLPSSELLTLTRTALPPGEYQISLKSGKAEAEFRADVVSGEETALVLEFNREKKNITDLEIKAPRP